MSDRPSYDVAIVGYGPVGAALAILLAQRGHSVVVLERHAQPYTLPRAVHFDHEVGRILQACGLGAHLSGLTEPLRTYEWRNAAGQTLLLFTNDGTSISGWPASSMFSQPELEALLETTVRSHPTVEVRRGVEVNGAIDRGNAVALSTTAGATITARYVVGCDGANSTVRDLISATVTDLGFFYDWLIVDIIFDETREFNGTNLQICDPARPTTVISGGPGRHRWEFMRLPDEPAEVLTSEDSVWRLLAPFDATPQNCRIERHAIYRFQARWVDEWSRGHVALAGDAAHQMPPFAGQGMCSGLRDAANLAWKLDLLLRGVAGDSLLDTYTLERAANVRAIIQFSMALGEVICVPDPVAAAARDEAMLAAGGQARPPEAAPGIVDGLIAAGDPEAGNLFVQGRIGQQRFDDVHGAGWRLVSMHPIVLQPALAELFDRLGGQVVHITAADDTDATYASWFAMAGVTVALQRPDFYLYGAGDDADALVGQVIERLTVSL